MSVTKIREGVYEIQVRQDNPHTGKEVHYRKRKKVSGLRDAQKIEADVRASIMNGTYEARYGSKAGKVGKTFEGFIPEFRSTYIGKKRANKASQVEQREACLKKHLVPYFGSMKLDEIDEKVIEGYIKKLETEKYKPRTINNHLGYLSSILRAASRWHYIDQMPEFPWREVGDSDKRFDFLKFDEAERVLNAAATEPLWHAMLTVALRCGLRPGELRALRWEDVDWEKRTLHVRQSEYRSRVTTPKDEDARRVPVTPQVVVALKAIRRVGAVYVFLNPETGTHYSQHGMEVALNRILRKVKLGRHVTWYTMRHTFATHLVMRGVHPKLIAEWMGHSTMEITERYMHHAPEVTDREIDVLDAPAPAAAS